MSVARGYIHGYIHTHLFIRVRFSVPVNKGRGTERGEEVDVEGAGAGTGNIILVLVLYTGPKDGGMCTWTNMYTRVRPSSRRRIEVAIVMVLVGRY